MIKLFQQERYFCNVSFHLDLRTLLPKCYKLVYGVETWQIHVKLMNKYRNIWIMVIQEDIENSFRRTFCQREGTSKREKGARISHFKIRKLSYFKHLMRKVSHTTVDHERKDKEKKKCSILQGRDNNRRVLGLESIVYMTEFSTLAPRFSGKSPKKYWHSVSFLWDHRSKHPFVEHIFFNCFFYLRGS